MEYSLVAPSLQAEILAAGERIAELEAALRDMTCNQIHDALCQVFEDWENPHTYYRRAQELLELCNPQTK